MQIIQQTKKKTSFCMSNHLKEQPSNENEIKNEAFA